ncbi:uncharacterized protein MONOS_15545 [Monocercomonoides exilis]|uniref:uncharacterized protein n=1 Tax=Monocercomonoides exilis TaxID=2049356 RepID=UPI003559FFF8|nr:hypothetical protein MONOS_15545 [Monocercomonoides exilis]|eukprot:MONOS_15545.1-p1 / transcript=MONOS_15545.1 / gene=MONOS_15545 / organism=Monocercomonoides_exilis_PA203 / gene_product=unspecified product / transcript_product=unspecified product / location=Mono_scaffold01267:5607-8049(+) / protein_length=730 / sequence_SO=supercontig / SO=protein_coding / is_pseudo=false
MVTMYEMAVNPFDKNEQPNLQPEYVRTQLGHLSDALRDFIVAGLSENPRWRPTAAQLLVLPEINRRVKEEMREANQQLEKQLAEAKDAEKKVEIEKAQLESVVKLREKVGEFAEKVVLKHMEEVLVKLGLLIIVSSAPIASMTPSANSMSASALTASTSHSSHSPMLSMSSSASSSASSSTSSSHYAPGFGASSNSFASAAPSHSTSFVASHHSPHSLSASQRSFRETGTTANSSTFDYLATPHGMHSLSTSVAALPPSAYRQAYQTQTPSLSTFSYSGQQYMQSSDRQPARSTTFSFSTPPPSHQSGPASFQQSSWHPLASSQPQNMFSSQPSSTFSSMRATPSAATASASSSSSASSHLSSQIHLSASASASNPDPRAVALERAEGAAPTYEYYVGVLKLFAQEVEKQGSATEKLKLAPEEFVEAVGDAAGDTKDRKVLGLYCKVLRHVLYGNAGLKQRVFSRRLAKTLVWLIAPPDASASVEEVEAAAEAEEDVVAALCRLTWQIGAEQCEVLVELGCVAGLVQVLEREPGNGKCRRMAAAALGNVLCVGACAVAEECPHPYGAAAEECRAAEVLQKCFEYEEDNQVKRDAARCLLLLSRGRALMKIPDNMMEFCWGVVTNTKREEDERANMLSALCLLSLCPDNHGALLEGLSKEKCSQLLRDRSRWVRVNMAGLVLRIMQRGGIVTGSLVSNVVDAKVVEALAQLDDNLVAPRAKDIANWLKNS